MLSEDTRLALQEHLKERVEVSKDSIEGRFSTVEDFHLSQFWYDEQSANVLAEEALERSDLVRGEGKGSGRIACLSCPSIYKAIRRLLDEEDELKNDVVLFEFDSRLSCLVPTAQVQRNFVHYDFREKNLARIIPAEFEGYFDFVVADPPYLNKECILAFQKTVESISQRDSARLFCTGAVLEPTFEQYLPEFRICDFEPTHASKLGNAFATFANYTSERLGTRL